MLIGWSHPARGAWIEMIMTDGGVYVYTSHPARGAWIEITSPKEVGDHKFVAPREGCVD